MNNLKYFIVFIIILLITTSCGISYSTSSQYYNISVLNETGKVVYHFPCVRVVSQNYTNNYDEITFKALDGKYYSIKGKKIILTETTYNTYRTSYYYYNSGPMFPRYPKYHHYNNYGPYRVKPPKHHHRRR